MSSEAPTTAVGTTVLFENQRLRVWELLLAPGETSPAHSHRHDHLIVYAEPAKIRAQHDGQPVVQHIQEGLVSYRAVGPDGLAPHQITNLGGRPSRHFIIELLGPSEADRPTGHVHNHRVRTEPLPATDDPAVHPAAGRHVDAGGAAAPDRPLAMRMIELIHGVWTTHVVATAAQLDLPDHLAEGPLTVGELVARTGAHHPTLERFLRACAALGLVDVEGAEDPASTKVALTPLGALLRAEAGSLRDFALAHVAALSAAGGGLADRIELVGGDFFHQVPRDGTCACSSTCSTTGMTPRPNEF
jgi:beta-alanine degradation protein BauB